MCFNSNNKLCRCWNEFWEKATGPVEWGRRTGSPSAATASRGLVESAEVTISSARQSFYQPVERPCTQPRIELGRLFQENLILTSGRHPPLLLGNVAPYTAGWRKPWRRRWAWTTGNRLTCKFLIIRNEASRTTGRLRGRCVYVLFLLFFCIA